jgi:hypothetical protein
MAFNHTDNLSYLYIATLGQIEVFETSLVEGDQVCHEIKHL